MSRQAITLLLLSALGLFVGLQESAAHAVAQEPKLTGLMFPQFTDAIDEGRISGNEQVQGVTLLLKQTKAQADAAQELWKRQQDVLDPAYHRWLTPAEYADRLGLPESGTEAVRAWLASEGFTHVQISANHSTVSFDGNAARIEQVFSAVIHRYSVEAEALLANTNEFKVPAKVVPFVDSVKSLGQLRPVLQPDYAHHMQLYPQGQSAFDQTYHLTPAAIKQIYNINALTLEGYTGQGQRIAVVGQSSINPDDIKRFRSASGIRARDPILVLVPSTGPSTKRSGDELEADIDVEYAGAIAPEADIVYVYTGSAPGHNVFDALAYAVEQNIAPIISISYGQCEADLSSDEITLLERVLLQANLQGQTVIAESGDFGAAGCETPASQARGVALHGLAVQYPASSQYVTSIGGTMLEAGAATQSAWATQIGTDGSSAESYVSERAWNESSETGPARLLGGGGGSSMLFAKPAWQNSPGVPGDGMRNVPDLALDAGAYHDGYLLCSEDIVTGVQESCSDGFLGADAHLTVAGGTSFGAPIVAGIIALVEQMSNSSRLGNLNPHLYMLASAQPDVVHDVTVGDNRQPCAAGSKDCPSSGLLGYSANPGYDRATGLGTPNVGQLAPALARDDPHQLVSMSLMQLGSAAYTGAQTSVLASLNGSGAALQGTIQIFIDGSASGAPLSITDGQAVYSFSLVTAGQHEIKAVFSSIYGGFMAQASLSIQISATSPQSKPDFTLSSTSGSPSNDAEALATVTISPSSTYSGQVKFTVSASDPLLVQYGCYSIRDVVVRAAVPVQASLIVGRSVEACGTLSRQGATPRKFAGLVSANAAHAGKQALPSQNPNSRLQWARGVIAACGVLLTGGVGRKLSLKAASLLTAVVTLILSVGCSVHIDTAQVSPPGTYVLHIAAADSRNSGTSSSINVTFDLGK